MQVVHVLRSCGTCDTTLWEEIETEVKKLTNAEWLSI